MKKYGPCRVMAGALLIAGNTIGAGILGLPILCGMAGGIPSVFGLIIIWLIMLSTGWILAWRMTSYGTSVFGLPSLYRRELGPYGQGLAIVGYLINYFGILVAYLCGAATIIVHLVPVPVSETVVTLFFFVLFTGVTLFGVGVVHRFNTALMMILFATFFGLMFIAGRNVELTRFSYMDWGFLPSAFPIIICAFTFHNTVPVVCRFLEHDHRSLVRALLIGTIIPLTLAILWTLAVVGSLPVDGPGQETLYYAFKRNLPATIPLSRILHSKLFTTLGLVFALLAIMTSYLAVGTGLLGFMRDLTAPILKRRNRYTDALCAFGLPLVITLVYPNLFLVGLNIAGGVGVAIAFGILPGLILLKRRRLYKPDLPVGVILLVFFILVLVLELCQESGLLTIAPHVEHWTAQHR